MINKFLGLFAGLLLLSLVSCLKDETENAENYATTTADSISAEARTGAGGCYEFVFPINIVFPDGTIAEVNNYEEMKAIIKEWKVNNPEGNGRPKIQFPVSVSKTDGTIIIVENAEQLKTLAKECKGLGDGPKGNGPKGKECFTINFPYSVIVGETTIEINSKEELKEVLKNAKTDKQKPQLVFPISVTLKDGTVKTVNSVEELRALKKECK
jgi:hypothetical protein